MYGLIVNAIDGIPWQIFFFLVAMVPPPDQSCWTMSGVLVRNQGWPPAEEIRLDLTIVSIWKMWLSTALVAVHQHILILQVANFNAISDVSYSYLIDELNRGFVECQCEVHSIINHCKENCNTRWVAALASSCLDLTHASHLLAFLQRWWLSLVVYQDKKHYLCQTRG